MVTETSTPAEALPNERQQNGQRLERTVVAGDGGTARHAGLVGCWGSPALSREPQQREHHRGRTSGPSPATSTRLHAICEPLSPWAEWNEPHHIFRTLGPWACSVGSVPGWAQRVRLAVRAARRGEAEFAVGGLAGPHQQGGARTGWGLLTPLPLYRCHSYSDIECACQLSRYDRRRQTWCL